MHVMMHAGKGRTSMSLSRPIEHETQYINWERVEAVRRKLTDVAQEFIERSEPFPTDMPPVMGTVLKAVEDLAKQASLVAKKSRPEISGSFLKAVGLKKTTTQWRDYTHIAWVLSFGERPDYANMELFKSKKVIPMHFYDDLLALAEEHWQQVLGDAIGKLPAEVFFCAPEQFFDTAPVESFYSLPKTIPPTSAGHRSPPTATPGNPWSGERSTMSSSPNIPMDSNAMLAEAIRGMTSMTAALASGKNWQSGDDEYEDENQEKKGEFTIELAEQLLRDYSGLADDWSEHVRTVIKMWIACKTERVSNTRWGKAIRQWKT